MKRIAILLAIVFTIGVLLSACSSSKTCPAYGEYQQYQRETIY